MKFAFKKKAEPAKVEVQVSEEISEDVLGQIWGGSALKECCHTTDCEHRAGDVLIAS